MEPLTAEFNEKESKNFDPPTNPDEKMTFEKEKTCLSNLEQPPKPKRKCRGHKGKARERSIKEVIELVHNWRGLAEGSLKMDPKSKVIKKANKRKNPLSRALAAQKVGIPKKSLDDYLLLLRQAKKGGFDFKAHRSSMMGELRAFIR